jgi:hypothetical protein
VFYWTTQLRAFEKLEKGICSSHLLDLTIKSQRGMCYLFYHPCVFLPCLCLAGPAFSITVSHLDPPRPTSTHLATSTFSNEGGQLEHVVARINNWRGTSVKGSRSGSPSVASVYQLQMLEFSNNRETSRILLFSVHSPLRSLFLALFHGPTKSWDVRSGSIQEKHQP